MNIYQIQLLDSVFKTNSLAKTAVEFGCAYQNVAYQLNKLDEEFGIKILTRNKNGSAFNGYRLSNNFQFSMFNVQ